MRNLNVSYNKKIVSKGNIYRDVFSISKTHGNGKAKYKVIENVFDMLEDGVFYLLFVTTSHDYGFGESFVIKKGHIKDDIKDFVQSYIVISKANELPIETLNHTKIIEKCNCGEFILCGKLRTGALKSLRGFIKNCVYKKRIVEHIKELKVSKDLYTEVARSLNI